MPYSRFLASQICLLMLFAKLKFSRKFPDLQYKSMRKRYIQICKRKPIQWSFRFSDYIVCPGFSVYAYSIKTIQSFCPVPWITPEKEDSQKTKLMQRQNRRAVRVANVESLKREIKADVWKQHDLYVKNLVSDVKANPRDFYRFKRRFRETKFNSVKQ